MKPTPHHPRFLRRTLTGAAALLVLLSTGAASADERRGDRGRHREVAERDHHRGQDRGGNYRHDRHRDRGDHYRHDRNRHRRDHYRHDRNRHRRDQYRHDRNRHRRDQYRHDRRYRHDDHRYRHDRYRYQRDRYDNRHHRSHFSIPRAIAHHVLHTYRPYHHGRVYYADHRHHHDVYRFPVYAESGVDYYPYAYCEGGFFARGVFRGGRAVFDVRVGF